MVKKRIAWAVATAALTFGSPDGAKAQKDDLTSKSQTEAVDVLLHQSDFLWVPYNKLTFNQKKLFDKLTPEERKDLSERVSIKPWQIDFVTLGLAIADKDTKKNPLSKKNADLILSKLWEWWMLPDDIAFVRDSLDTRKFYPDSSPYDAMVLQMPWLTEQEKVVNFLLLSGMKENRYWTNTKDSGVIDGWAVFVTYSLSSEYSTPGEPGALYNKTRGHGSKYNSEYVRPIKKL
jgi:hypothetical protein